MALGGQTVDDKDKSKKKQPEKSKKDQWRERENAAVAAENVAAEKRHEADQFASDLAQELIEKHGGAPIEIEGVRYAPKKGATRKMADGNFKAPKFPYQLVVYREKTTAEI